VEETEAFALRPDWLWTGDALVRRPVIAWEGRAWSTRAAGLPVRDLPGLVLPGLVNAHTHLELAATPTPSREGIVPWVAALRRGPPPDVGQAHLGAAMAWTCGTALLGDVTNTGASAAVLADGPTAGVCFLEVLGIDRTTPPDGAFSPHAPHSTHPDLVRAAAARAQAAPYGRWTVHCDEDPDERAFLQDHSGRWPPVMRAMGRDLGAFPAPGCTPVEHLRRLGVLSPHALLVHLALTRGADLDAVAESGARAVLCPRSNLHITGTLPDAEGLLARGVPLALGTDSLASSPDLDVLAEAAAARAAFPGVPVEVWLRALTASGADALGRPEHGRIAEGTTAPLLHVDVPDEGPVLERLLDGTRWRRRWLGA
jgi:cytosine/adenosine deaminase-related metal-dependent hydrolase